MRLDILNNINFIPGHNFKYHRVDNYLYRGSQPYFFDVLKLKQLGVTQIYDFRHKSVKGLKFLERIACKFAGIKYQRLPLSFLTNNLPTLADFEKVAKSIRDNGLAGGKTFLHCRSGRHRTAQMVTFYDITKGLPLINCKKNIYPKTYPIRVQIALRNNLLEYSDKYFNRTIKNVDVKNLIKRHKNQHNNFIINCKKRAYDYFCQLLNSDK